jgi:hypothetical protein
MNKIIKFNDMLLLESKSGYFSFTYKDESYKFEGKTKKGIFVDVVEWLYKNNYNFKAVKVFDSVPDGHRKDHYHNIGNSNNFIDINFIKQYQGLILMLSDFGVEKLSISFGEVDSDENSKENLLTKKYTFVEAAQLILKQNSNKPMTSHEVWSEVESQGLLETSGKTPWDSMNSSMILYSENTTAIGKKKNSIFRIIEDRPYKFTLINPNSEVQYAPDEEVILSPSDFIKNTEKPVKNPFKQSICILGPSGKGKSTTTELMLEQLEKTEDSDFEFIIPTASTTGLLSQYSPSGRYIKSRLGKMIMSANNNPKKLVTAVFDECHKSAVIEMINDELLQCISIRRNNGKRFISVDEETEDLYPGLEKHRGNLLIPNNFGFIFLSSKPDVIIQNSDFFNRVDIYVLTEQPPKDADLSLGYDEKGNVILPSYFIKIEGKGKDDEDKIKSLLK